MGTYLNPDNTMFYNSAIMSEIYVDKTELISVTNKNLFGENKYMCISRPRRFGKSMAMNMLCAYYSKGADSAELFHNFKIVSDENFTIHLNRYNVIQLNMRDFISRSSSVVDMIDLIRRHIIFEVKREIPDVVFFDENELVSSIDDVYNIVKVPFVFLIDEWDAIFRVKKSEKEEQEKYLDFLRNLLKDKPYVALAYMTGILPIKKYGEHSALNMFTEYSMTNQRELAEYTGFTEDEVKSLCEKYDMSYDEAKRWYDGYRIRGIEVYNPRSVVSSMTGHDFDSYWTKTETYEALKVYIEMNFDGLKDRVIRMIAGEKIPVNTAKFSNDMTSFKSADDVCSLLIHLGYLTYDFDDKTAWIPNSEVQQEFINSIEDGGWEEVMAAIRLSDDLLEATLTGNEEKVAETLEIIHRSETSIMAYNDENALASVISIAYYSARKSYDIARELSGGDGFADLSFLPRRNVESPALVVELKVNKSVEGAIDQIKRKNYVEGLRGYSGDVILVGINYDKKEKRHSCRIEKIRTGS